MGLPDNFTLLRDDHPDEQTRNTMLGNTWRLPSSDMAYIPPPTPTLTPASPIRVTAFQHMTSIWLANQTPWGPPPECSPSMQMPQYEPCSMDKITDCTVTPPTTDGPYHTVGPPTTTAAPKYSTDQNDVLSDIQQLVTELQEHTQQWWESLPAHCQTAYTANHP